MYEYSYVEQDEDNLEQCQIIDVNPETLFVELKLLN